MKTRVRLKAKTKSLFFILWQGLHEIIHMVVGFLFYYYFVRPAFPQSVNLTTVFLCLFAALLPDIDHLLYFFVYGKKKEYTQIAKIILHEAGWRELTRFFRRNHKRQTGLVSHNLLTVVTLGFLTVFAFSEKRALTFAFLGSMMTHFLMDMIDDAIFLGGLNPNWYLKFGREAKARKRISN